MPTRYAKSVSYCTRLVAFVATCIAAASPFAAQAQDVDFQRDVVPVFTKYCTGCHNDDDLEGGLSVESFESLQEGGDSGVALLPEQADASRLIRVMTGKSEPKMPPKDNQAPSAEEIELLRAWVDAGAKGPSGAPPEIQLITPHVQPTHKLGQPVTALAISPDASMLAKGEFQQVHLLESVLQQSRQTIDDLPGKVNSVHFTSDGSRVVVATGETGLRGKALIIDVVSGDVVGQFSGHSDAMLDAVLSPDQSTFATCSYDRSIILWDVASGEPRATLTGHNGAVYDLEFSPDGKVLASASADETVKLWRTEDGVRLDTLGQPEGEQYAVTFSPDGRFVVAGGADSRIRVWRLLSVKRPRINPIRFARFGHEGAITHLAYTAEGSALITAADDQTLKAWQTKTLTEIQLFEHQPELITALAVSPTGNAFVVGRMDGTHDVYSVDQGALAAAQDRVAAESRAPQTDLSQQLAASVWQETQDSEPNDEPNQAQAINAPAKVAGTIADGDADMFRFSSHAGAEWLISAKATGEERPLDAFVEVLDDQGQPIERVILQAVRDSYFTFRGKDSDTSDDFRVHNWEEMTLNQYLYANGEVVKLWLYPRGPDSGFRVYPGTGKRFTYFDTTALSHALGEPCYIVEPHEPGTTLIPNGLPTFTLYYENDDDSRRAMGKDSRLTFRAPHAGEFLVRITDARGFGGEDYTYDLVVRPRQPDYRVKINQQKLTIPPGSGQEFQVTAERLDDFDGAIRVDIEGMPEGFHVTSPLVIEAGQQSALGTLFATADATTLSKESIQKIQLTATAEVRGQEVVRKSDAFESIELGEASPLLVRIVSVDEEEVSSENVHAVSAEAEGVTTVDLAEPLELTVAPGETVAARVRLIRKDFEGEVQFGGDDSGRNLPHGVYVDNIGLNGLTILAGQNERAFFIKADDWVPEQTRTFFIRSQTDGNPTSQPVVLHVRQE